MYDILIVGAGPAGLCAARTILECDDGNVNLRLIDSNKTLGGVWATENLYPSLKTNNLRGGVDFSDFPMDDSHVPAGAHIPGEVMHDYLEQYATKWDILRRIDFSTTVDEITRLPSPESGWSLRVHGPNGTSSTLETAKLIIATGITNRPHHPLLPAGHDTTFAAPIIHSAALGTSSHLITAKPVSSVAVLGGAKSAYDAAYLAASSGKHVHWIIRASGKGPVWVFPPYTQLGPITAWRERLPVRRFIACFSPWLWDDGMGWLRRFLHGTWLGKKVAQAFWADIHHATLRDCRYKEKGRGELGVLEPEQSPFWYGTASGVYNYPKEDDLYRYIREGKVTIHRADIVGFAERKVRLSTGLAVPADALVTATGFSAQPAITFSPASMHSELGLPSTELSVEQDKLWAQLTAQADERIGEVFPRLVKGPFRSPKSDVVQPYHAQDDPNARFTPWRLYRSMAPPGLTAEGKRDLVFVGMFSNISNTVRLELQCLWAYAYLMGSLEKVLPRGEEVWRETALWARYWQLRAPYGHGRYYPDAVFDQLPCFDMWLKDLGLKTMRKGSWFKELFESYSQADYRHIVKEWLASKCKA